MLRITLYKNVILNETYQNVFSMGKINDESILEKYLNKIENEEYVHSNLIFELEEVYQENNGTFIFDYSLFDEDTIYEYNYMKIETIEEETGNTKLLRYAFINSIKLVNELVYLTYKEDMWSSYSDKIFGITESYLNRSRVINYGDDYSLSPYKLPIEYDGNNYLNISKLNNLAEEYYIIGQVQYYNTSDYKTSNKRFLRTFLLSRIIKQDDKWLVFNSFNDIFTIQSSINELISKQSLKINLIDVDEGGYNLLATEFYYEIQNITLIPSSMIDNFIKTKEGIDLEETTDFDEFANYVTDGLALDITTPTIDITNSLFLHPLVFPFNLEDGNTEVTINNNFKNISVGTFSSQFPIINNGTDIKIKTLISVNDFNFDIYIAINNNIYNITNDFVVPLPFSQITGDIMAQRGVMQELKNNNIKNDKIIATSNFVGKTINNAFDIVGSIDKASIYNKLTSRASEIGFGSQVVNIGKNVTDIATSSINYGASLDKLNNELDANNAPVYSSTKGIFSKSEAFTNANYGICIISINSDNDEFVKKSINNLGYITYNYINDISKLKINNPDYFLELENPIHYNVIQFKSINTYGSFTREIANILNTIFKTGVKIWFDENMEEDTLVVG